MNCVRVSVLIARQRPKTLDMVVKKIEKEASKSITVDEAKREAAKQSDGLDDFQLVPKDAKGNPKLQGEDLLRHMIKLRNAKFTN